MTEKTHKTSITIRINEDLKARFKNLVSETGTSSDGEFFGVLLDHYTEPEKARTITVEKEVEIEVEKIIEKPVEVERELAENELIIKLNPAQMLALKNPVLHKDFVAISNNEVQKAMQAKNWWTEKPKYPGFFMCFKTFPVC